MTVELLFFCYLFFLGGMFSLVKVNDTLFNIVTLISFIGFSFVVRRAGFDADMANYNEFLQIKSFSIYYIKEPVYWLGSRVIFELTESTQFVFMFYDIIFICLLLFVRSALNLPKYFPYLVLLFFPTVLGMQNVFRQFIASGFILLLLYQVISSKKLPFKICTLIVAGLSHNVAILFIPMIFINAKKHKLNKLFVLSGLGILLLLPLVIGSKSSSDTGDLPPYLYVVIFSMLIFMYILIFKFKFSTNKPIYTQFLYLFFYLFSLLLLAMFFMGGAQSKRIGMLSFFISLIPLVLSIEYRFKQKVFVRVLFLVILVLPTLLFHNASSLLKTSEQSLLMEAESRKNNVHH